MGPRWAHPGTNRTQVGPMWATWILVSGILSRTRLERSSMSAVSGLKDGCATQGRRLSNEAFLLVGRACWVSHVTSQQGHKPIQIHNSMIFYRNKTRIVVYLDLHIYDKRRIRGTFSKLIAAMRLDSIRAVNAVSRNDGGHKQLILSRSLNLFKSTPYNISQKNQLRV